MAILRMVRATEDQFEEAYDLFYRSFRKMISEGKAYLFGGMTPQGTKNAMNQGNYLYLFYRKGDELPVVAISILKEKDYGAYEELLKGTPLANVITLNAIVVRPELLGQGYARNAIQMCVDEMHTEGFTTLVGTVHPQNETCLKTLKYVAKDGQTFMTEPYIWKTPNGRVLERKRFMCHI